MKKCAVCGKRFKLKKENKYETIKYSDEIFGFKRPILYEAFDCPKCGCQNIVNKIIVRVGAGEDEEE